ncbi:hypothetical protein GCM10027259_52130 [Micromonospora palomenae]
MNLADDFRQLRIAHLPLRRSTLLGRPVTARGDLQPVPAQHATDRLDSTEAVPMLVNETHERVVGRSSSAAKKADAAFKISFARRNSAFSRRSRFNSADSSDVTPGRWLSSTCA